MKDKHNVILILVSSSKFNSCFPEWFIILHSWFEMLYLFFSKSSKLSQLYHHGDSSKSLQGFTLSFSTSLSFRLIILLFTGVLHEVSAWWSIKDLTRSRNVHQDYFQRSSSFLLLAIRSAILSTILLEVVLCHSW